MYCNSLIAAGSEVAKPSAGGCASLTSPSPSNLQVGFCHKNYPHLQDQILKLKLYSASSIEAAGEGSEAAVREEILTKFHKHLTHKSKVISWPIG